MQRRQSLFDKLINNADQALRTLVPNAANANRDNPGDQQPYTDLPPDERKHVAGLMRINHCGEVCAQALYQGQALTAKLTTVREEMEQAAQEEIDHLVWCEQRLHELDSHSSLLNPAFYAMSFAIGAAAGLAGDRWSLGFVAATEEQVCKHLQDHLLQLPENDRQSRAILEQMLEEEQQHGDRALRAGGENFSLAAKSLMSIISRAMTRSTYHI